MADTADFSMQVAVEIHMYLLTESANMMNKKNEKKEKKCWYNFVI